METKTLKAAFKHPVMGSGIIGKWLWRVFAVCLQCKTKSQQLWGCIIARVVPSEVIIKCDMRVLFWGLTAGSLALHPLQLM